MKNEKLQIAKYIFFDFLAAASAYLLLFVYRKYYIDSEVFGKIPEVLFDRNFIPGLLSSSVFWIVLFVLTGFYKGIFRRSRLKEFVETFLTSLGGSLFIFFLFILDDSVTTHTHYYKSFFVYFSTHFTLTALFRATLSTLTIRAIRKGKIRFNTLIVGSNEKAVELYNELRKEINVTGNRVLGFVSVRNNIEMLEENGLPHLGSFEELPELIDQLKVEEVILAIETREHSRLEEILNILEPEGIKIRVIPDMYDIISGQVKMESFGTPLIEIRHEPIPLWQQVIKRTFDILSSLVLLVLFSPIILVAAIMVKFTSKGPVFFHQERIGKHGKSFHIIKFRSMYEDAEKDGPQLSSESDDRITPWGRVMRKYRIDELPQFFNVLIGEMSVVGPRPERQYYIDRIVEKAPYYKHLLKVKPGITSWGMVKFGYAENVEQMIERMKYDIIYIENVNLFNDLKVLIYTILIVLQGRGK